MKPPASTTSTEAFLTHGGEIGQLIRSIDWSKHALGAIHQWPQTLRTTLGITLPAQLPLLIFWSSDFFCFYNHAYKRRFGAHNGNWATIGRSSDTICPEVWAFVKPLVVQVLTNNESKLSEDQRLSIERNGHSEASYWTFSVSPIIDEAGQTNGVLVACIETTEKVRANHLLATNQEQFQFALQASELGIWHLDIARNLVHWDSRCQTYFGFAKDDTIAYNDILAHIHPDDRLRVNNAVQEALNPDYRTRYDIEFRTISVEDQQIRWLRCQGKAYFNDQDVADRFAGTAQDITAQMAARENLQNIENQARLAVESAGAGTFLVDLITDNIVYSTTLAKIFTGNETKNLTRESLKTYILPEDKSKRAKAYQEADKTGKLFYEARVIWDNGSIHWVRVMGTYLYDSQNKPVRFAGIAQDISAEVEADLEQKQLASLVEGSPEYMSIASLDGSLRYINPYGLDLLGLKREDVATKNLSDLFYADDWYAIQHEYLPLAILEKQWQGTQYYRHVKTGERIPVAVKRFVIDDPTSGEPFAIVATGRDLRSELAAQKELEAREADLQKANQNLEMALHAGKLGSYDLEFSTGLMQCTAQCKANFGLPADAIFNFPDLINAILPEDRSIMQQAVEEAVANRSVYNAEYRTTWPDGSIHWIRASGKATYDDSGLSLHMAGITMDITAQRMAQQELERQVQERTQELSNANQELIRTNHELEQFAYIASHDLQEPLRKIQSFASLLPENRYDDDQFDLYLNKVILSAQRMSALIKGVLNYSRLSKIEEAFSMVDLNQVISHVLSDFELLIDEKKAIIRCHDLPAIEGIPLQLNQLFFNLIGNALKFSDNIPAITIHCTLLTATESSVILNYPTPSDHVHISVKDNGIGFDPQYADRVFTIFQRLTNGKNYGGTGIGLALCRKIVTNHQGMIKAESELQKGSTFHVYLPVSQSRTYNKTSLL